MKEGEVSFKLSEYCHFVDNQNLELTAAYNALTLGVVIIDRKTKESLYALRDGIFPAIEKELFNNKEIFEQLIKHKILLPLDSDMDKENYFHVQKGLSCRKIGLLYLLFTDVCNLACSYCFVENAMPINYHFSKMTEETAINGINLFANALQKCGGVNEPQIIFYGGEPLLNLKVMTVAIEYINLLKKQNKLPTHTSITLNTNGTLINQEIINILKKAETINIAISLDGPEDIHNASRPYHNKKGSYNDIIRGWELLRRNNIEAGFCCTINRKNVDYLKEIAVWFVEKFDVQSLGFNIMIENEKVNEIRGNTKEYALKASQAIIDCFRFFRERGVYEDRIMRKVNAFIEGSIYYYDCGGCGNQLVVSPNGLVGVCQGYCGTKKNFINPDVNFNPLDHPLWNEWSQRSPLSMPQCRDCIALSICGGGCPYSADLRHGNIWELDDIFCIHAKETTKFLLEELIKENLNSF